MNRNKKGSAAPKAAAAASKPKNGQGARKGRAGRQLKSAPVAQSRAFVQSQPRFVAAGSNGDVRVVHREYFSDLLGSVAFASNAFNINPGLSNMFPWLSQVAGRFEAYHFNRLSFSFETESATSATGTVLLVVDPDAADAAPTSKSDALAYRIKNRGAPWEPFDLPTPPLADAGGMSRKYVRQGALAANLDIKMYDAGQLFACTTGQSGVAAVGELYVDYDVSLYTPQVVAGSASALRITGSGSLIASTLFGTAATVTGSLPATVSADGKTLTFTTQCELLVAFSVGGTVISGSISNSGTATQTDLGMTYNGAATAGQGAVLIRASPGQTYTPSITATTITGANWRFGAYSSLLF
jgi:hypothetical protein